MKIFMCVNYPKYNPAIGISKKIATQIEIFQKMGYDVTYSAYSTNGIEIYEGNNCVYRKRYPGYIPNALYRVIRSGRLMKTCELFLRESKNQYDIGFIRWNAVDNNFLKAIQQLDSKCNKVLMDCHGYHPQYNGKSLVAKYIKYFTNRNSHKLSKYVDQCLIEFKGDSVFGIPALAIDTGIDVDKYQPHRYIGDLGAVEMVSVANETSYHGYDRIIRGLAEYKGNIDVHLHLVGKMSDKTVQLVSELAVSDKVFLHGYQTGKALDDIYAKSNIGVGPLAPHKLGGKQGTGIKTKEYFAIGLPYFYAGQELLVPIDYPYVLRFDANDSPIDVETVIEFYDQIKHDEHIQENMRSFARENYSWKKIFSQAIALMESR